MAGAPHETTSLTVTPILADAGASVSIDESVVGSGTASGSINLVVGVNTIPILVTAQDNSTTNNYVLSVVREPSNDS